MDRAVLKDAGTGFFGLSGSLGELDIKAGIQEDVYISLNRLTVGLHVVFRFQSFYYIRQAKGMVFIAVCPEDFQDVHDDHFFGLFRIHEKVSFRIKQRSVIPLCRTRSFFWFGSICLSII